MRNQRAIDIHPSADTTRAVSPFDEIKHVDQDGEHWFARELQRLLKYDEWRNFDGAVVKAIESITVNDGVSAASVHIVGVTKTLPMPNNAHRDVLDYRLTRYGAYRVTLECDGRKPEVAAAKHYFAIKTHEAETRPRLTGNLAVMEQMIYEIHDTQLRLGKVEVEQEAITARVDSLEGRSGWHTALAYCKMHHLPRDRGYRQRLGVAAKRFTLEAGLQPGQTPDERYGTVGCYPDEALQQAAAFLAAGVAA